MPTGKTKIAGVVAWPVSHSLSPKLHNYWLDKYKIDGEYKAFPVKPEELPAFIADLRTNGMRGINLTLPHKKRVIPMLDAIDDVARAIDAVNTVVVENGRLIGSNTDAYGFGENIRLYLTKKGRAVVLGAGGAAPAVVYALKEEGFKKITVLNRTEEKAQAIARQFGGLVEVLPWEKRGEALVDADLLVNTTSLGLKDHEPLDIDLSALPEAALVTDIVYTPLVTPLLSQAKALGNPIVDGLGMLLHQAVPGFEAWFGVRPEVTKELRACLLEN